MIRIVNMDDTHISEVFRIFNKSITPAWSISAIKDELKSSKSIALVALCDDKPIGFLFASYVLDECDLTNIAVDERYRKRGAGKALINELKAFCNKNNILSVTLEVRVSNKTGINFYERCGFEKAGHRKDFYQNPKEDAYIYKLNFKKEA